MSRPVGAAALLALAVVAVLLVVVVINPAPFLVLPPTYAPGRLLSEVLR